MTGLAWIEPTGPPVEDSIPVPPIEGERAGIEFRPIPASALGPGDAVDWLWFGWLARGFITLLVGLWKAGKTTLLAHLLSEFGEGGDIAGQVNPVRCLVIAEEGAALWARRRDEIGFGDHVHFVIRPFKGRPQRPEWEAFVRDVATWVQANKIDVVILDTWQSINPCHDENDAAKMMAALTPLHAITEAGAAVLLVHHPRKGDAGEGQASRGSGALPGFVDIIMELRRYDAEQREDRRRVLRGLSRFDETPAEVVVELGDEGYRAVGSKADAKRSDRVAEIVGILADAESPVRAEDVRDRWPEEWIPRPGLRTLRADLEAGFRQGRWNRAGMGKKGDPFRYAGFDSGTLHLLGPESNQDCDADRESQP